MLGRSWLSALVLLGSVAPSTLWAQVEAADTPYAGLDERRISSLSEEDIAEIRRGGGWGLALPAELAGVAGPAHVLELRDELGLSSGQVLRFERFYEEMRAEAIEAGNRFIEAEAALSDAFAQPGLDETRLRTLVEAAAAARAELRFVHLSRHLVAAPLLTPSQAAAYSRLRGYTTGPAAEPPRDHGAGSGHSGRH